MIRRLHPGRVLNLEPSRFINVAKIGDHTMAGTTRGALQTPRAPSSRDAFHFFDRNSAEEHAANIQHEGSLPQGAEFSLHRLLT